MPIKILENENYLKGNKVTNGKVLNVIAKKNILAVVIFGLLNIISATAQIKSPEQLIGPYRNLFTSPPSKTPGAVAVDGPLLGNGSLAVAIGGPPEQQSFYLARNDFWRLKSGFNESFPAVLGKLEIDIPSLKQASYKIEQRLYTAVTTASFQKGETSARIKSEVMATKDWLIVEIENDGKVPLEGKLRLTLPGQEQFIVSPPLINKFPDSVASGEEFGGIQWIQRGFVKEVAIPTIAAAAMKIIGLSSNSFLIQPGRKITIVCASSGNFRSTTSLLAVQQQVRSATMDSVTHARKEHVKWWQNFWYESFVDIGDSVIEHQYYKSHYIMASCSRDPRFPPGIFGSWVTTEIPAWNGDYHLNYNYSAPFYGLYSSNHLTQATPYQQPLLDFVQRGNYYSKKITGIPGGILYPVGIGPLGIETTRKNALMSGHTSYVSSGEAEDEGLFFGQKSNAAYCAVNLSMQFYKTYDLSFTRQVYPFIRSVAIFWQNYLKKDGERYIIENDAIHEGTIGTMNPILSLGLVPMVLRTAVDMSALLGTDAALREDWKLKAGKIAGYTTQIRNGTTVFRYSEKGTEWWNDNTLGIQHIYPAGQIGLNSDTSLLRIARNTISAMKRWKDFNGSNSFFPAAVRVGYNPDTILSKLHEYSLHTYPNGFQLNNPHGIENASTVPNTINEMLCMSHQGIIRVFEVWPKEKNASFANIRCDGAFLVSAAINNSEVGFVQIISEKGRPLVIQNPWIGKTMTIKSNKRKTVQLKGARVKLLTLPGENIYIVPLGVD